MQQRRPRLGDVLDDYCPRERRVTNHVVVAMIEDQVKQTRCTTCDGDHVYKQAKTPSPRKPKTVAAIHDGAEAFAPKPVLAAPVRATDPIPQAADDAVAIAEADIDSDAEADDGYADDGPAPVAAPVAVAVQRGPAEEPAALAAADDQGDDDRLDRGDEGPVHRRLIRATLPRPEGHVPERKEPEFTIRQQGARGGGPGGGGGREVDGNRAGYRQKGGGGQRPQGGGFGQGGGHSRFGGQRHGSGAGQPQRPGGRPAPNEQRGGRPDAGGVGNPRGQRGPGSGSGRRRGGR